jgi:hypothetical protein
MAIHIDSERFGNIASKPLGGSQYLNQSERKILVENGTKTKIQGDVYIQEGVAFKRQSKDFLRSEKLEKPEVKLEKNEVFVAFRNPDNEKETLVIAMDKQTLKELEEGFGKKDFFKREDEIVRLSGQSERYVAGWLKEINHNRGYAKADIDENGFIDKNEEKMLNIGFERRSVYEYTGENITSIGISANGDKYQPYANTINANNPTDIVSAQTLEFKSTVNEELLHTIKMDKNKDGKVSLKEGLEEFVPKKEEIHEHLSQKIKSAHVEWIHTNNLNLNPNRLAYREIPTLEILTEKEREERLLELNKKIQYGGSISMLKN